MGAARPSERNEAHNTTQRCCFPRSQAATETSHGKKLLPRPQRKSPNTCLASACKLIVNSQPWLECGSCQGKSFDLQSWSFIAETAQASVRSSFAITATTSYNDTKEINSVLGPKQPRLGPMKRMGTSPHRWQNRQVSQQLFLRLTFMRGWYRLP